MKLPPTLGEWTLSYEIEAGSGGNAEVWCGVAADGTEVALKVLQAKRKDTERYERFEDEVAILQQLRGTPGVLPILDANLDSPPFWHASPLAESIWKFVERNDSVELLRAVSTVTSTLAELARRGISHRDIKPSNLLVLDAKPLLADFGLAKFPGKRSLTTDAKKLGPQNFFAPEMLTGPTEAVGEPADVWSLAKTMWVLVNRATWPPPGTQRAEDDSSKMRAQDLTPTNARQLEFLIERCTHMDPARRPGLSDVAEELSAIIATDDPGVIAPMDFRDLGRRLEPWTKRVERTSARNQELERAGYAMSQHFATAMAPAGEALAAIGLGGGFFQSNSTVLDSVVSTESRNRGTLYRNPTSVVAIFDTPQGNVVFFGGGGIAVFEDGVGLIVVGYQVGENGGARFGIRHTEAPAGSALAEKAVSKLCAEFHGDLRQAVEIYTSSIERLSS